MKFNAAFKYQLSGMKRPLIIFYIVVYCLILLMIIQQKTMKSLDVNFSSSGFETATMIFLFVTGLNSFKSTFHMFLANGVSRKSMFKSYLTAILPITAGMALIDSLNGLMLTSLGHYKPMFFSLYHNHYGTMAQPGMNAGIYIDGFIWMFFFYTFITMAGFLITTVYYRMNKQIKLLVLIGVPVFLFIVLPYVDTFVFKGAIFDAIGYVFAKAGGFLDGDNPYIAVLSCAISFVIAGGLSFLAIKKATVKQ